MIEGSISLLDWSRISGSLLFLCTSRSDDMMQSTLLACHVLISFLASIGESFVSISSISILQDRHLCQTPNDDGANDTFVEAYDATNLNEEADDPPASKPKAMSRLAIAAADWMEEEEDELFSYWDRFDDAKSNAKQKDRIAKTSTVTSLFTTDTESNLLNTTISTEERLDRYFKSRGIDKSLEKKHSKDIERAMRYATNSALCPMDAIQELEKVQPYMQIGSNIGGSALLELAYAYQANGDIDEMVTICNMIIENNPLRELRKQAKQLKQEPEKYGKKYERKNFWTSFDSLWS